MKMILAGAIFALLICALSAQAQSRPMNTEHPTLRTQNCTPGQQRDERNVCVPISHEPAEVGKTYKDICTPASTKDGLGHCNMKGYDIAIPFSVSENGSVYVQTSVDFRPPNAALLDTGSSGVLINDLPTTDEMKGAETITATTASGNEVRVIQNELPVCVVVETNVWLCQKTTVSFGGNNFGFLLGNSFTKWVNRMIIDRRLNQIIFKGHTPDSTLYLVIDKNLYVLDNF